MSDWFTPFRAVEQEVYLRLGTPGAPRLDGASVLCPMNDPEWSGFTRFFTAAHARLGLHRVLGVGYPSGRLVEASERTDWTIRHVRDLDGDGDFLSPEVTALRDAVDLVAAAPPFGMLDTFLDWAAGRHVIVLTGMTDVTGRNVIHMLGDGELVLDGGWNLMSPVPETAPGVTYTPRPVVWLSDMGAPLPPPPLQLDTMAGNLRYNTRLRNALIRETGSADGYPVLDGTDILEVPSVSAIPSDWAGRMAVPVSFWPKWNPGQFEPLGPARSPKVNGRRLFARLLIRRARTHTRPA